MTSVTQKIPNFIGGISQQPDELMPQGSVRDAVNVIPDVTDGLRKRSGSRLVNPLLTDKQGTWFHFNFADNQKYIGNVKLNGEVNIFSCATGLPEPVYYGAWEQDPNPSLGYPNCDYDSFTSAKMNWTDKLREVDEKEAELNNLNNEIEAISTAEEVVKYYEVQDNYFPPGSGNQPIPGFPDLSPSGKLVVKGYSRVDGKDVRNPEDPPEGWKWRRGEKKDTFKTKFWTVDEGGSIDSHKSGEGYELIHYKEASLNDVPQNLLDQRETLEAEVNTLRNEADELYGIYSTEADKCGFGAAPSIRSIIDSDVPPSYLKQQASMQLKTLTVGNTIFFVNPEVPVTMADSAYPKRPTENFIEVIVSAPNKVYSLELQDQANGVEPFTEVTRVSVIDGDYEDEDSACVYQGIATETFNDGDKTNLKLTVTVTGNQSLEGNGNSLSDYVCKYTTAVTIDNPGTGWQEGDVVELEVAGKTVKVRVDEIKTRYTASGKRITPPITDTNVDNAALLADIEAAIKAEDPNFITKIIGNGIYVTHADVDYTFTFSTAEGQLMNIVTNEVNNISDLPYQCRGGYVVKIVNTDSDFDDYYAVFETEYDGIDGPGAWVEIIAPGFNTTLNANSMPHQLRRNPNGTFVCAPIDWEPRLVGDDTTNPRPSFVSRVQKGDLRYINKMAFFRNRLCMLSGDNVICSRPGDYFNFFKGSALALVDNDPIDIAVGATSSSTNAKLYDAIEVSDGLVVFSGDQQFLLSTDSEVFSPRNARFNRIGTYRYTGAEVREFTNPDNTKYRAYRGVNAFSLGTTIGFTSNAGLNTKLMEMYNISRSSESSSNELTKPVSRLIPYGVNLLASSKDNNILALSNRNTKDVWVYRYFDNDQQRQQSSWFRWTMLGDLIYHCIMDDVYWSVSIGRSSSVGIPVDDREIVSLQRIDLKDELATAFVTDQFTPSEVAGQPDLFVENGKAYQAHMDNYRIAQPSEFTYYPHINQTYFRAPLVYYKDLADAGQLVAYMLSPTQFQKNSEYYGENKTYFFQKIGGYIPIRVEEDNLGTWFVMDGDWSRTRMMIGYQYEMKVEFPTLYPTASARGNTGTVTRTDTRASLTLHRLKLNFGQTGVYETTLKRLGRDDYTQMYESAYMDKYPANEVAFVQEHTQTVPVYATNKTTDITLTSSHPSPATLNSMEWEGEYTNMYYRRV